MFRTRLTQNVARRVVPLCIGTSAIRSGAFRSTPVRLAEIQGTEGLFERYSDVDNSNEKRIRALSNNGMCSKDDDWIGTEKVHGANFGIYFCDFGKRIRYSKRSGIMPDGEVFFGYQVLIPEMVKQMQTMRQLLCDYVGKDLHTILVNGELFGGKYDHPGVPKSTQKYTIRGQTKGISMVQSDDFPQYSPNLHFYAFDLKYKETDESPYVTVTFDAATGIFEKTPGLLYARAIVRGTMDEVAAFDIENFQTTIPNLLGLGDFPLEKNWSEGLIVRHARRGEIGWEPKGATMLKFKCVAFQEIKTDKKQGPRSDPMFDVRQNAINRAGAQLPRLESVFVEKSDRDACQLLMDHICDNRLKNVISKLGSDPFTKGEVTPDSLSMLLAKDALKDFIKDEADEAVINGKYSLRSEFAKYCLFESRKFVCAKWLDIMKEQAAAAQA